MKKIIILFASLFLIGNLFASPISEIRDLLDIGSVVEIDEMPEGMEIVHTRKTAVGSSTMKPGFTYKVLATDSGTYTEEYTTREKTGVIYLQDSFGNIRPYDDINAVEKTRIKHYSNEYYYTITLNDDGEITVERWDYPPKPDEPKSTESLYKSFSLWDWFMTTVIWGVVIAFVGSLVIIPFL